MGHNLRITGQNSLKYADLSIIKAKKEVIFD